MKTNILALGLAIFLIFPSVNSVSSTNTPGLSSSIPEIVRNRIDAVVLVMVLDEKGSIVGQGSGFFVSANGLFVTNYHVIKLAANIMIKLTSGAYYYVEGVNLFDCTSDLAILKVRSSGVQFPYLPLGDSLKIKIGDRVTAIGSPYALEATISEGIISGIRQNENNKNSLLQTTAPISPGSSGGPLLNINGEVIGIINASLVKGQNINFAVPSERINLLQINSSVRPVKEIVSLCQPYNEQTSASSITNISGTYAGIWQSSKFSSSGGAVLKVLATGDLIKGWFSITGSPIGYQGDEMLGELVDFGEGIWTVHFVGKYSAISAKAIFKEGKLIGDYRFQSGSTLDQGQWILKK